MDDSESIQFVNEEARPICEAVRDLKIRLDAAFLEWEQIKQHFESSAEEIEDHRETEGIALITTTNVLDAINALKAMILALEQDNRFSKIETLCIRSPISIE